jgi:RimJ/RimL family protein N-acetyltransferase
LSKPAAGRRPRTAQRSSPSPASVPDAGRVLPFVAANLIRLEQEAGSAARGGPGSGCWHIHVGDTRVGTVRVSVVDSPPQGTHATIQIRVRQGWQGRGVGRVACRLASDASGHDTIYAHMHKNNVAARTAATYAGYTPIDDQQPRRLIMVWNRSTSPQ